MINATEIINATILIVDDEPQNIRLLGTILKNHGYRINVARNGPEALDRVLKVLPDLILLDIMMPEMDGFETCERLRQLPELENIPIIFLTARTDTEAIVKGFQVGGVDYIPKPFNTAELLARIHTHIDLGYKTRKLKEMAEIDGLTQIANRRRFDTFLELEWRRCIRDQNPISLILVDIDHFKEYNDYYGHPKGDVCLKQIAKTINTMVHRPGDLAARYGGEEFAVILGNTGSDGAKKLAENIRTAIEQLQLPHCRSHINGVVTVSLGVATLIPKKQMYPGRLINIADRQLYNAKNYGRNQVRGPEPFNTTSTVD